MRGVGTSGPRGPTPARPGADHDSRARRSNRRNPGLTEHVPWRIDSSSHSIRARPARAPSSSITTAGVRGACAGGIPADLPEAGLGRARPGGDLVVAAGVLHEALAQGGHRRARPRRDRHHQPARDDAAVGSRHRQADRQRDRLAGPAHRSDLRRASRRGPRGDVRREDRTRHRRLLLRHEAQVAARSRSGRARARARGRARVRHRRQLARLAAHRRPRRT